MLVVIARIARIAARIFGVYGVLIFCMAAAAGRLVESFPVYGKPMALAFGCALLARWLRTISLPPPNRSTHVRG